MGQRRKVLDTDELLSRLEARGARNVDIAKALGLPDSRVPEIRKKRRALKLEEAVKLVRAFGLEQDFRADPLPAPIVRLVVRYLALELGVEPSDQQVEELTRDVQAFGALAADQKFRGSVEAAEGFFRALHLRRREPVAKALPGTDPEQTD